MIGTINLDLFNVQVCVFKNDKSRVKFLRSKGVDATPHNAACLSSSHFEAGPDGAPWFSMVIKKKANLSTLAHECVHIADYVMDVFGIPCTAENTEVRAYLVGHLFGEARDLRRAGAK